MDCLYDLSFYTNDERVYQQGFFIGLFLTEEEAESVAARYSENIPGFKDYDCIYRVTTFPVVGGLNHLRQVYRFEGWNTDEDLNETDIIISNCFADLDEAEKMLAQAKKSIVREEWVLNSHVIGKCDWEEGFVRE